MTKFASGAATDVGQVRQVNQDSLLDTSGEGLFAVADGMGGHRGGEVASEVAIDALKESFSEGTIETLVEAVKNANRAIVARAKDDPDLRGMGTTMCVLARVQLDDGEECLAVVNVGDSRAYLLKSGDPQLFQVSEDHSLVATLVRQGQLTPEEAAVHPQRNILTRALGIDQEVLPDSFALLPVTGDRYLLCSDGLFNEVDEVTIGEVLAEVKDPTEAAVKLVRLANDGGGHDNITVVIVDVIDDDGHDAALEEMSDEHRVFAVVHGPERIGEPAEDAAGGKADASSGAGAGAAATQSTSGVTVNAGGAAAAPSIAGESASMADSTKLTWRVGAFIVTFLAIFAVAFFVIQYLSTSTYFVGVDQNEVAIFQGRPGGFAWNQPVVVKRTGIAIIEVPPEFAADITKGRDEASVDDAQAYVARVRDKITGSTSTSTSTSTTTSTARAVTSTTSAGLGGQIPQGADGEASVTTSTAP